MLTLLLMAYRKVEKVYIWDFHINLHILLVGLSWNQDIPVIRNIKQEQFKSESREVKTLGKGMTDIQDKDPFCSWSWKQGTLIEQCRARMMSGAKGRPWELESQYDSGAMERNTKSYNQALGLGNHVDKNCIGLYRPIQWYGKPHTQKMYRFVIHPSNTTPYQVPSFIY